MRDKILNTIFDLIKIPSISGDEKEISKVLKYCKDFFEGKKVYIREFKYQNASPVMLISNCEDSNFDVLVVGHLDVVPAKKELFSPRIEGGKLFGRGSADMKGQIAVALYVMNYVLEKKLPIKYGILITTDEETTSSGAKAFAKNENIKAKIVMDYDAGDLYKIIEKYKHSVGVKLSYEGVSGHSSRPWLGTNAVEELMKIISKIQNHFEQFSKKTGEPENSWLDTMAVTSFNSPVATNVIPAHAESVINFRLTDKMSLNDLKNILDHASDDESFHYDIFMSSCGCYMDANNEIIQGYKKLAEKKLGREIKISHMHGATDARLIGSGSIIIMHSINGQDVHNDGEYAEINSIFEFYDLQKEFLKSLLQ